MSEEHVLLGARLAEARERAGFSQDEVATLVGQPRPVISTWESGTRRPNSRQLGQLAAIYRVPLADLLEGRALERPDFQKLMFRDAADHLTARSKFELQRFLAFLDDYGDLQEAMGERLGMTRSPLAVSEGFSSKEDVRRKAEEARAYFRLGTDPVRDLNGLADLHGITVYQAPLGEDLTMTVSGAFLPHDRVGFSILVNGETTPGRRQFTLAHEFAHALFHGDRLYVSYRGRRESAERFANEFASEFLVPVQSLRATVEGLGLSKVREPEVVIHLQRFFGVSYAMILVRLKAANLVREEDLTRFREVRPVHLADQLGYSVEPDEWGQAEDRWGLSRFPRRFLRLLRRGLEDGRITIGGAARITGLAHEDIDEFSSEEKTPQLDRDEYEYLIESA
jgi:transcriptional regulator with XRE-family HTH domain